MKKRVFGTIIGVVTLTVSALAGETGFIQVKCGPGVQIFLDKNLKGVTNTDVGGLIIQNVKPGEHELKAVKPGFHPQVDTVTVAADQVVAFEVKPFVPKVNITQEGEERQTEVKLKVGTLQIQSLPIDCSLTIAALGVDKQAKNKDRWQAKGVPVGKYTIIAEGMDKRLTHKVEVYENETAEVFFNFVSNEIKDIGAARHVEAQAAVRRREQELEAARMRELGIEFPAGWVFVPVVPGSFQMGSNDGESDEKPVHTVRISQEYWMGKHEVTQQQYESIMGSNPSSLKGNSNPVEKVSWNDSVSFCKKLTDQERKAGRLPEGYEYRLPTEAEWEYAARGGKSGWPTTYAGSDTIDDVAWHKDNSGQKTHAVGQKQGNEQGLYDMSGNVYEWCLDWKGDYSSELQIDPVGPGTGSARVLRGGSWRSDALLCRVANRSYYAPTLTGSLFGFRAVLAPPVSSSRQK